jgi:hypothetical protein
MKSSNMARPRTGTAMFKILELKSKSPAPPTQVGDEFDTREAALVAVKRHLKTFKISGHNPEERYWWVRDTDGLRKCWIAGP